MHAKFCHHVDMGNLCNMHAGSWNMHVGICNMHVETQHLFLMTCRTLPVQREVCLRERAAC